MPAPAEILNLMETSPLTPLLINIHLDPCLRVWVAAGLCSSPRLCQRLRRPGSIPRSPSGDLDNTSLSSIKASGETQLSPWSSEKDTE